MRLKSPRFAAVSRTDFELIRQLIDEGGIPDGVTPVVMIQLRADLIGRDRVGCGWRTAVGRLPVRHGERSCNCDLVTLALNLYTQGVDLRMDFFDIAGVQPLV